LQEDDFVDWIATVAFYKALHLFEALLSQGDPPRHSANHTIRENHLKQKPYHSIYKHYRDLQEASLIARYLQTWDGKVHSSFSEYMSAEKVQNVLLKHRLRNLEKLIKKRMKPD